MAGIGFELRRMIDQRDGFVAKVRAYACAGLISSGPWLMTILTLTLLNLAGPYLGGSEGYSLFRALVTYAFAFSLVLTGVVQMAVTRRVADLLYAKQYQRVLPACAASLAVVGLAHALIGGLFCAWAGFAPTLSALATTLFTVIGMTWIALIWLSIVRQYDEVLRAYVYGTLVAMVGVVLLFLSPGTTGVLAAYTAGQAFTLVLLLRVILRGMETEGGRELGIFRSLGGFPLLVGVGLFYNAAIWADKIVFWFRDGIGPHPLVRYHPLYDTCSFLAYLTVVPALALNLVRLETSFYEKYRAYYGAILAGTPYGVISDRRERMFESLKEGVVSLLRIQGAITAAFILFAPVIIDLLELPPIAVRLFRLTCLGALFHVLLLINILMQMYFDLRKQAFGTALVFLLLNGGLAWWSVGRGVETYGVGYATAAFLTLLFGFMMLMRSLEKLDYHTFTSQPIASKEEREQAQILAAEEKAREEEEEEGAGTEADPRPQPVAIAAGEMGTIEVAPAPPAEEPAEVAAADETPAEAPAAATVQRAPAEADATATDVFAAPAPAVPQDVPLPPEEEPVFATAPSQDVPLPPEEEHTATDVVAAAAPKDVPLPLEEEPVFATAPPQDVPLPPEEEHTATDVVAEDVSPGSPPDDRTATDVFSRAEPKAPPREAAPPGEATATDVTARRKDPHPADLERIADEATATDADPEEEGAREPVQPKPTGEDDTVAD